MIDYLVLTEIFIGLSFILGSWTVILGWFYENKKILRWKSEGMKIVVGFFTSIILNVVSIIIWPVNWEYAAAINVFGLVVLLISLIYAIKLTMQMTRLESFAITPTRRKAPIIAVGDDMVIQKTGVPCIDKLISGDIRRAPIVIFGVQGTHPWRLAQHFAYEGLINGEAVIYLTTSKPPEQILEQFKWICNKNNDDFEKFKQDFAIIDCFTPFAGFGKFKSAEEMSREGMICKCADLRDLNDIYKAIDTIREMFEGKKIRMIYDNFSSLAEFSDPELLYQLLLHQIAFEERSGYISLYIVRKNEDLEMLQYLVPNIIKLDLIENKRVIEILKFSTNFKPGVFAINELDDVLMRVSKPKLGREISAEFDHIYEERKKDAEEKK
jgi:KaiC/GvpD/RAD55 family RecA-like ATPase